MKENPRKIVVIRPGALGDTLVLIPTLRFLKDAAQAEPLVLLAPSGRGRFLCRDGWADEAHDWDGGLFAPLFQQGKPEFSERLQAVFRDAALVISFAPATDRAVRMLAPNVPLYSAPPVPPFSGTSIYAALHDSVRAFCEKEGFALSENAAQREACLHARISISESSGETFPAPYIVMHPGSGSRKKNWPVKDFAELALNLLSLEENGMPKYSRLIVTAGEADAELGEELVAAVPGAALYRDRTLEEVAGALSRAELYVGNDSGVSHLAASVCAPDGSRPKVATLFGPSDRRLWAPRGAAVVDAGIGMNQAAAEDVFKMIKGL